MVLRQLFAERSERTSDRAEVNKEYSETWSDEGIEQLRQRWW
jgi:hypothetical protein